MNYSIKTIKGRRIEDKNTTGAKKNRECQQMW